MIRRFVTMALVLSVSLPLAAHHSIASEFNFDKAVTLTGVLVRADWVIPHPYLILETTRKDGVKTRWMLQTDLGSKGAKELRRKPAEGGLKPGDAYTALGFAATDGTPKAFLRWIKFPDGHVVTTFTPIQPKADQSATAQR
jgi:hypothetical protein